jgi:hypothetical protein
MEKKTLEIAIPEGKIPEMTETASGCTSKWVDSKEKTFEDYADEYRLGGTYNLVSKNPLLWSFEEKMGLLKYIADDLNGCDVQTPASYLSRYRLYVIPPRRLAFCGEGDGKEPAVYFTIESAEKAIKIIPVEFILSF